MVNGIVYPIFVAPEPKNNPRDSYTRICKQILVIKEKTHHDENYIHG